MFVDLCVSSEEEATQYEEDEDGIIVIDSEPDNRKKKRKIKQIVPRDKDFEDLLVNDDDDDDGFEILMPTPPRLKKRKTEGSSETTPSKQVGEDNEEDLNGATISFGLLYLLSKTHSIPRNQNCIIVHSDIYREITHEVSPTERNAATILEEYSLKNQHPRLSEYILFPVIEQGTWSLAIVMKNLNVKDDASSSSSTTSNQVTSFRDVVRKGACILHLDPNPTETTKHSSKRIARRIRNALNKAGADYKATNMPTIAMPSMSPKVRKPGESGRLVLAYANAFFRDVVVPLGKNPGRVMTSIPDGTPKVTLLDSGTFSCLPGSMGFRVMRRTSEMSVERMGKQFMSVMTEQIPSYWSYMRPDSDSMLVDVESNSLEYFAVKNHITLPYSESVRKIQRVQSRTLLQAYLTQKMRMHKRNDGVINEYLLFHGTKNTNPDRIWNGSNASGFDPRLGQGYYGQGAYFAEELKYSYDGYSHHSRGNKQLFLAAVLTGKSKAYGSTQDQQLRRAPELPNRRGLYDSVNGQHDGTKMHVVYEKTQSYPLYLITFGTVNSSRRTTTTTKTKKRKNKKQKRKTTKRKQCNCPSCRRARGM